jgi:hypothetical protein
MINPLDQIIEFVIAKVGWDSLGDAGFRNEESLKQYIAFQAIEGNIMWATDPEFGITGVLIAYECDEEEAYARFDWKAPTGKSCIFVAQLASTDPDSTRLLAHGFLQRFKDKKTTIAVRRGSYTTMKAHDIASKLIKGVEALN